MVPNDEQVERLKNGQWIRIAPPFQWRSHGLTVIGDAYREDGTRKHVVLEEGFHGQVLDNAEVYSISALTKLDQEYLSVKC